MKALGAVIGFLIAGIVAIVVVPRFRGPSVESGPGGISGRATALAPGSTLPANRIDLPSTPEQELREETTRKRLPFFQMLRTRFGREISSFGVTHGIDTLDIVVTNPDPQAIQALVAQAVSPTAEQYGFRKVRAFIANPSGTVEPLTLVAESTYDGAGRWNTFLK